MEGVGVIADVGDIELVFDIADDAVVADDGEVEVVTMRTTTMTP